MPLRLVKPCWTLLRRLAVALAIALAVGVPYVWFGIDDEIRSRVEAKFDEHYGPLGLDVKIASARLIDGDGIQIRNLSIVDPSAPPGQQKLLDVEEIFVACEITPAELMHGRVPISQLRLIRPTLHAIRRADGHWNVAALWPPPKNESSDGRMAPLRIEGGAVEWSDGDGRTIRGTTLRNFNFTATPQSIAAPQSTAESFAAGKPSGPMMKIEGEVSSDFLRQVKFSGMVDPIGKRWQIAGAAEGIDLSPALGEAAPIDVSKPLQMLGQFRAQGRLDFSLDYDPNRAEPLAYSAAGALWQGRWDDPRLPSPLTDVSAKIHCDPSGLRIENLMGRSGAAEFAVDFRQWGLGAGRPCEAAGSARNLSLDRKMVEWLDPEQRELWDKYRPGGQIDVDFHVVFDGRQWTKDVEVRCIDASFTHYKYPLPMRHAAGTIRLKENRLTTNLTAYIDDRPVTITGEAVNPGPQFTGYVDVRGENIPITPATIAALSEPTRQVVQKLHPTGAVDFSGRFEKNDPDDPVLHHQIAMTLHDGSIDFEGFPYEIPGIGGVLHIVDRRLTLEEVRSRNVRFDGGWNPEPDGGRLQLRITADDVPLEAPLRNALKPAAQKTWDELRPRGTIDRLTIDVDYQSRGKQLDLRIEAEKRSERAPADNGAIVIMPAAFPIRLDGVHGRAVYRNGRLDLRGVRASHGRTTVRTDGFAQIRGDQGFHLRLERLEVEQLPFDRDLLAALPGSLRRTASKLNLAGAVALKGTIDFDRQGPNGAPVSSGWDVTVGLQQAAIDCGAKIENIHGEVRLVGQSDGPNDVRLQGKFDLDAATYRGFQFSAIQGPFELVGDQLTFGTRARRFDMPQSPAPMQAKLFGGTLSGDAVVVLTSPPSFWLQTQLTGADLRRFAMETMPGRQNLSGRVSATLQLEGSAGGVHTLRGGGKLRLRDADVFELPVMVAMLKVLSVRVPDSAAFTTGDVDYRIEADHVYLNPITLRGDAISLLGTGDVDFNRQVHANFFAVIGRDQIQIPVIRPLLAEASRQIMEIRVDGPLENPRVSPEAFRGAKQFLERLEADLTRSSDGPDVLNPAREVLRNMGKLVR